MCDYGQTISERRRGGFAAFLQLSSDFRSIASDKPTYQDESPVDECLGD
jgi:hypothetical protein